ncbi:NAD binding 9 domain containing protein [Sulfitobacter noctilucae]|uniref:FAD/NAD(P)-binding protein n=1 Tax=Sulfitobacter noctilucae TaxID=1342302 RepID=UPI0004694D25|nr:FAD/NAD(P)-binding domain-containing protein [Sulfitobacter noctilucae]KIN65851.1 NAD binding 9 domain containing protein [Sulfitobacter noctilucae]
MTDRIDLRVAIVGFGPRSLGALESLIARAMYQDVCLSVDIFDPCAWPGAGPNYSPDQSELCILNIPVRAVDYPPPSFLAGDFPYFADWVGERFGSDAFPPRSCVGAYFWERFVAVQQSCPAHITVACCDQKIVECEPGTAGWMLGSAARQHGPYDEVLLCQGQPSTESDPQIVRWTEHAAQNGFDLLSAYPANALLNAAQGWSDKVVATRGLGLSTLDVLRLLTKGTGGAFEGGEYKPSGREPRAILPFSLNGKLPVAKPATGDLDRRYDPTKAERSAFSVAVEDALGKPPEHALRIICDALIEPATRICSELQSADTGDDVRRWLEIERSDPGAQDVLDGVDALKVDIEMAHGRTPPSAGYAVGQVWRKLQYELREIFNGAEIDVDTAVAVIKLDEGFKRLSYGPPVRAAEELLALIKAGTISLCVVEDPAVVLGPEGWQLVEEDDRMTAQVMVDAVIPNPALEHVCDDLIRYCMDAGQIVPVAEGMGANIAPDAQLRDKSGQTVRGLSMLGRLTLGSVIAVDGLHDCFGPSADRWANAVLNRNHVTEG